MANFIETTQTAKRVVWIDYAKFIGIILVICGHQTKNLSWFDFISGFDIPLFFFLSGFLFSFKKYDSYQLFLKARIKQLVVPYLLVNFITYVPWLIYFRHQNEFFYTTSHFYKSFVGIFYGNGYNDWLMQCIPSWFIICLFTLENIYFLVFRHLKGMYKYLALASFFLICWLDGKYDPIRWPWGFNVALVGIIFYGAANIFRENVKQLVLLSVPKLVLISLGSLAILLYAASRNHADMNLNLYNNYFLFFTGAFGGIVFALTLSRLLDLLVGHVKLFEYIAQNTLFIMAFHLMVMTLINMAIMAVFDLSPKNITDSPYLSAVVISLTVFVLLPLIQLCNQYFPVMLGKPHKPFQRQPSTSRSMVHRKIETA